MIHEDRDLRERSAARGPLPFNETEGVTILREVFWARRAGRDHGATTQLAPEEPARRSEAEIGRMDRPEPRDS